MKSEAELHRIGIVGVRGDALKSQQLRRRLDVTAFKCAIILCDQSWLDPDLDLSNGVALKSQSDMLRLDALVMAVNLNIRKLLEACSIDLRSLSAIHLTAPQQSCQPNSREGARRCQCWCAQLIV